MIHPTLVILKQAADLIRNNTDGIKQTFFLGDNKQYSDLPQVTIGGGEEEIEPYHNKYIVNLSLRLTWHFVGNETDNLEKFNQIMADCDSKIKSIVGVHSINESEATPITRIEGIEIALLTCSKTYSVKYIRSRGF